MTQSLFAARFGFPLATLRHWEYGRRKPTGASLTLLNVIAHNPRVVMQALRAPLGAGLRPIHEYTALADALAATEQALRREVLDPEFCESDPEEPETDPLEHFRKNRVSRACLARSASASKPPGRRRQNSLMAAKRSAGMLLYRIRDGVLEVLLVHPGGPFWAKKDAGAWTIPKGEIDPGEDAQAAARRELAEETGLEVAGELIALAPVRQRSGKVVHAWAAAADCDPAAMRSNTFSMEWPPRSGKQQAFPEIDRAAWFGLDEARVKILPAQVPLLAELERLIHNR
jgi:predicted NUDIX family NTP pyrophosphohydrolase